MPFLDEDGVTRLTEDYLDIFAPKEELGEGDGTNAGPIYELSAKGHAEQFSTTGKNLLPNTATSQTVNGVTFTINADGSITARGTATVNITRFIYTLNGNRLALPVGSYVLSDGNEQSDSTQRHMFCSIYKDGAYKRQATSYGEKTFAIEDGELVACGIYIVNGTTIDATFYPQLELGSTATEYEPYTGGAPSPSPDYPQEIQVVRGRNLIDWDSEYLNYKQGDRSYTASLGSFYSKHIPIPNDLIGKELTLSMKITPTVSGQNPRVAANVGGTSIGGNAVTGTQTTLSRLTFTPTSQADYISFNFSNSSNQQIIVDEPQLELGASVTPYVPYGHVGMEVRDPDTDELISCTPIPLPQRGWVGGLPDGTSDILTLDGAGKCEWELDTEEYIVSGTEGTGQGYVALSDGYGRTAVRLLTGSLSKVNNDYGYCTHGAFFWNNNHLSYHVGTSDDIVVFIGQYESSLEITQHYAGATILYPLATPIHESKGYIEDWPTDIPEGATITIPELDALNVKYFVSNDSIPQYAEQWYNRTQDLDIAQVEDAVVELTENLIDLTTLDPIGGLERVSDGVRIGSLVQESDGYACGGLAEVTAKGHAEQFSTTGKNLLPNTATSQTVNGVTFTVNADGSITANGTASDDATRTFSNSGISVEAGTYMFSGCPSGGSTSTYRMTLNVSGSWFTDTGNGNSRALSSGTIGVASIVISSGYTCDNLTFYPMLEAGSAKTEYEPYTGGAPSPSPDYPQEIQVVRGRNLLDLTGSASMSYSGTSGTTALTLANGLISCSGNASNSALRRTYAYKSGFFGNDANYVTNLNIVSQFAFPIEAGTYTFKCAESSSDFVAYVKYGELNSVGQYVANGGTFTVSSKCYATFAVAFTANGSTVLATISNVQLTLGSTPQPYVPYGHVGMEVTQTSTLYKSGYALSENGTEVANANFKITHISAIEGNYAFDGGISGSVVRIHAFDKYGNWISSLLWYDGAGHAIFSAPENTAELRISQYKDAPIAITLVTPIPLPQRGWVAGLPDGTADVLRLDGAGKCEWEEATEEVVFDGSSDEHWGQVSNTNYLRVSPNSFAIPDSAVVMSDIASYSTGAGMNVVYTTNNTRIYYFFSYEDFPTVDAFKSWLSTHPATVLYPLATPITEDCGYIDMPDIPSDCTVTIPELDALGIHYFVDNSVTEYGKQFYARAYAELGDAIVELTERVATLEQQ